jgi:hypothetical protein
VAGQAAGQPSRRLLIAAVAAGSLGLAGCKGITALGPVPQLSPSVLALERAIAAEEALSGRYQLALSQLSRSPGTARRQRLLSTIHHDHLSHLRQLRTALVVPAGYAKSKLHTSQRSAPALPGGPSATLAALAADERAAAARLTAELLDAPPSLAQLLASIAASEAAHVVFLRQSGSARSESGR